MHNLFGIFQTTLIFRGRKNIQMLLIEVMNSLIPVSPVMGYIQEVVIVCQSPLMGLIRQVTNNCTFDRLAFVELAYPKTLVFFFIILYEISDAIRTTPSKSLCKNITITWKFFRNGQKWINGRGKKKGSFRRTN